MQKESVKIVIVGHVDHGKSTLIGRLLLDTNSLPKEKFMEIERISKRLGKKSELAFLTDQLREEREQNRTIDTTQIFFKTKNRNFVIIDTPGHLELLKNMITGSCYAETALLVIDAQEGLKEQTKRHCYLLNTIGVKQICILINKMDLVDYRERIFSKIKDEIIIFLKRINLIPSFIIPISAREGDNIINSSKRMRWFLGPTTLEALDNFKGIDIMNKPLRFPIQDVYLIEGKQIAVGRVESGAISLGETLYLLPEGKQVCVKSIERFPLGDISSAQAGECIGISLIDGGSIKRGQVLSLDPKPNITHTIRGNIFWMDTEIHKIGESLVFRCVTQEATSRIGKIAEKFDPASMDLISKNPNQIKCAELANAEIILDHDVIVDPFSYIPEMGRFVLERDGNPVGGGVIL